MTILETSRGRLEIRELRSTVEMAAAERIQVRVWGPDTTPHPKEILIPMQHVGGLVAGTFTEGGEMVGMIFGFPTRDPHLMHSHLLATLEEWRGCGIGAAMKWFQRAWCLERDILRVHWTVDPLRAANAELNIRRLGGAASTYYEDYYGSMSGIDAGAPSDRLLVEWELHALRVAKREQETPEDVGFPDAQLANGVVAGNPVNPQMELTCPQILINIPENFIGLARSNPALAQSWRLQTRELFEAYFSKGYTVTGFTRVGGPAYLLTKAGEETR
jgi:chorismate synthase